MRGRDGIYLGWESQAQSHFGFGPQLTATNGKLIEYAGDGPVTVIAPTGSGKGRDLIIPLLLSYDGPVIVLDIKGELSAVTARRRRAMGHHVDVLDPFGVTGHPSDRLNPLDILALPGSMLEPDAEMLASQLSVGHDFGTDPFWSDTGRGLIGGLIAAITYEPPANRHMGTLRDMLFKDDTDHGLAVRLDVIGHRLPKMAYREIAAYLQHAHERTRPSVLSTARTFLSALATDQVVDCLKDSTISLADVRDGEPLDIFITIGPEKLKSHRSLIRLWITVLLTTIMRRKEIPARRTLLVLDEAAQMGPGFDPLLTAITLLRGYGLGVISVWQDLSQIKSRYPMDWPTILNNSAAILCFGQGHFAAARDFAEVVGLDPSELLAMKADEAALSVRGEGTRMIRRLNYLKDRMFEGLADPNPYYRHAGRGL